MCGCVELSGVIFGFQSLRSPGGGLGWVSVHRFIAGVGIQWVQFLLGFGPWGLKFGLLKMFEADGVIFSGLECCRRYHGHCDV